MTSQVYSSSGGNLLRRHVSVAKRLQSPAPQVDPDLSIPSSDLSVSSNVSSAGPPVSRRVSTRDRKLPSKFSDFDMN